MSDDAQMDNLVVLEDKPWWFTEESVQILNRGYLLKGEDLDAALHRICTSAANKYIGTPYASIAYSKFRELIYNGWMSLSSPIWSNMGTTRGLPISCYNVHIPDTIEGITRKLGEVIMQTKLGGGTSGYFGELRERGSAITDNGKSSGAVSFMELFNSAMNVVSQGSTRRGAFAAYLDIDHSDFDEFLRIKDIGSPIQNLFFGACIKDYWMQEMIDGDVEKRKTWAKLIGSRQSKGLPYLFYTDNVNRNKPQIYKDRGMLINSSNLCVHADTKILTDNGYVTISDVADEYVNVWNGEEFTKALVKQTGINQQLFAVTVNVICNGQSTFKTLNCTAYHKWYNSNDEEFRTTELVPGMLLNELTTECGSVTSYEVIEVSKMSGLHDTFCFNEPKKHKGVFNGILTGQCSEIALPSTKDESFICCLSSMNLELYDDWKDTDAPKWAVLFLDAVLQEYIEKTANMEYMEEAHKFAKRHRAIGLGVMGWHSYLQRNMIPFESLQANMLTNKIFKHISEQTHDASVELGEYLGYAPIFLEGPTTDTLRRNTTTMAIAPTTSSSAILGQVSPGIEPFSSNYYKAGLSKGNFMRSNKYLKQLFADKGIDNEDTWRQLISSKGSVQHMTELTDEEKAVFKTFKEISQSDIITQASIRQKYIDQAQSLNINIPPEVLPKDVNKLFIQAWEQGVKTIYYQRSENVAKEFLTNLVSCGSCEA